MSSLRGRSGTWRPGGRLAGLSALGVLAALVVASPSVARAQEARPPKPFDRPFDWPSGRSIPNELVRPKSAPREARVCGLVEPVCVHVAERPAANKGARDKRAPQGTAEMSLALGYLASAERAMSRLRRMGLPTPRPDGSAGGSPDLDLYLVGPPPGPAGTSYRVGVDPADSFARDRASAFALVADDLRPGCAREAAIARSVALAQLAALDAGESGGTLASSANYLAWEATGCVPWDAVDDAQTHPEWPMIATGALDDPAASPLLPFYLDAAFNAGVPGSLYAGLFRAGAQQTPATALRYTNLDLYLTLAKVAKSTEKKLADVLSDAAIARAFHGDREDGLHIPSSGELGAFGRVRFDGSLRYDELPKRFSFTPVYPTGATYTWVDLAGAPKDASIIVSMAWEEPITLKWSVLRIGADGQELSRVDITREPGVYEVQRTIFQLENAIALLIVGVSVGETNPAEPFKLDDAPYTPHGGTVYVLRGTDVK